MATLREYLSELATDPKKLGAFIADPDAALEETDLSEEDRELVKSGDLHAINSRLVAEGDEEGEDGERGERGAMPTKEASVLVISDIKRLGELAQQAAGARAPVTYPYHYAAPPPFYAGAQAAALSNYPPTFYAGQQASAAALTQLPPTDVFAPTVRPPGHVAAQAGAACMAPAAIVEAQRAAALYYPPTYYAGPQAPFIYSQWAAPSYSAAPAISQYYAAPAVWAGQAPAQVWAGQAPAQVWAGQAPAQFWAAQAPAQFWAAQAPAVWGGQAPAQFWAAQAPANSPPVYAGSPALVSGARAPQVSSPPQFHAGAQAPFVFGPQAPYIYQQWVAPSFVAPSAPITSSSLPPYYA